jgi:hypothetical protein
MNFDDKAKTWDSDPVKQERALAVAAVFRQRGLDHQSGQA